MAEQMQENKTMPEARKKRIRRMKYTIIGLVLLAILIPMILCVVLLFKVSSMQKQIDGLYEAKLEQMHIQNTAYFVQNSDSGQTQENLTVADSIQDTEVKDPIIKSDKTVYLTFDDGPSSSTDAILDVLKAEDVKATFFVVGKTDEESIARYKRIVAEGHTLAMHSYSHKYDVIYNSLEEFEKDVSTLQDYLEETTGVKPTLYRFPGGSSNLVSNINVSEFIQYLNEEDITYFDWNVACGDATNNTMPVDELVQNVMHDVDIFTTSVVLMHDASDKPNTVAALPIVIEKLKEAGIQMKPLDDRVTPVQHIKSED